MEISLCMIVKNEADVLARCLKSVSMLVDEIIIVDTGSNDETKEIAKQFTDQIYDFTWVDDFSKARNFAFAKATKDYQMWLDADDIFKAADQQAFLSMKAEWDDHIDMAMLKYDVGFDEQDHPTFSYYRERIMKRSMHYQWVDPIHEVIPQRGEIRYFPIAVSHKKLRPSDPDRNLRIFQKMLSNGILLNSRQTFYYARELYYHKQYEAAIPLLTSVLNGTDTWLENRIDAALVLASCYQACNNSSKAKQALLTTFCYSTPRSEVCCELGHLFFHEKDYQNAIYWYEAARTQKPKVEDGGFHQIDTYDYIPCLQLCVCYDRLHNLDKAIYYNELAGTIKPNDRRYLYNKEYFKKKDR